jgi:site-specific DNA recombinase
MKKQTAASASSTNTNTEIRNVAIYLRVSTGRQNANTSKETQLLAINNYISQNKVNIGKMFTYEDKDSAYRNPKSSNIEDETISSRPGLNELLIDAKLKKFDCIIVYSHDRLTRNVHESLLLKFLFERLKIKVIYCKAGEQLDTESEKINLFFDSLLNNLAQLESSLISSRVKPSNEYNIKNNYWAGGPPPFGYKLVQQTKRKSVLSPVYTEVRIVKEIFDLYIKGYIPKEIAEIIREKYGNTYNRKWTVNTIKGILSNKDYTGVMVWDKKGGAKNPVKHSNPITSSQVKSNIIVDEEVWNRAERIRSIQKDNHKIISTPFILNGLLVCGNCGKILKGKNNGEKKGRVYYCLKEKGIWDICVDAESIEETVITQVKEHFKYIFEKDETFNQFYEKYIRQFENRKKHFSLEISELEQQIKENEGYITECNNEIIKISSESDAVEGSKEKVFLESLHEFQTYLSINKNVLKSRLDEVNRLHEATVVGKNELKKFWISQNNYLEIIKKQIDNPELYRRSLRILLLDIIDKITVIECGKEIEIFFR